MSRRLDVRVINRIVLLLICCLLTLFGCAEMIDSPAITGTQGSRLESTEAADVYTGEDNAQEAETQGRVLLAHPFSYQVDLTHDGRPELLTVDEYFVDGAVGLDVSVIKGNEVIWSAALEAQGEITGHAYFLCSIEGEDYLLVYRTYLEESSYRYAAEIFSLTVEGETVYKDNGMIAFDTADYEQFPLDGDELAGYAEWLNWYLDRSTLLCSHENGTYTYSTADKQLQYREEFAALFAGYTEIAGAPSIEEKVELVNEQLFAGWFGDEPDMNETLKVPDEFYEAAGRITDAAYTYMWMGKVTRADRELWFKAYRGKDLQIVRSEDSYTSPLSCNDVVYYRAGKEETVQEIAQYMVERLVAEMAVPSDRQSFEVTDYRILEQTVYDWESSLEEGWQTYLWESRGQELTIDDFLWEWLGYADEELGFVPLGENMWYFTPNGYFSFEGECLDGKTFDELATDPKLMVGGKISLVIEEDPRAMVFVLIKEGEVYRLQRAQAMEKIYQELISE